ncbi:MAG: dockerin type I repeat-containing protein [Clostridia bacterium]|nr:dockerin type I repeat-containing protein [Clostridia bacterium]
MKKTMRIMISCLLCTALLLPMGISALAENGPFEEHWEEWYPAFLYLAVLDEKEEPVTVMNEYGFEENTNLPLWANNKATPQEGAVYDKATNTLTLTDFNKGNYSLSANMMGDDFTVCVKGDCRLSSVKVWGDGWGGSLRVTGDGTLAVNPNSTFDCGISFMPEGAVPSFTVDPSASVTIRGSETAISVRFTDQPATVTVGGKAVTMKKETVVRDEYLRLKGYSNIMTHYAALGKCASDDKALYEVTEQHAEYADGHTEDYVAVTRYIYVPGHDLYLEDYDWAQKQGGEFGEVKYDDLAAAEAAGFTRVMSPDGEYQQSKEILYCGNHHDVSIYEDAAGNRYGVTTGYNDEQDPELRKFDKFAYSFEPLAEPEGEYLFLYAPGVDPATLTEVIEKVVHEGEYDYTYPDKELKYTAQSAAAFLIGDVDNNGKVESADARLALRASVKLENYAEGTQPYLAADVDHNGKIESSDARSILRASVNLEKLA